MAVSAIDLVRLIWVLRAVSRRRPQLRLSLDRRRAAASSTWASWSPPAKRREMWRAPAALPRWRHPAAPPLGAARGARRGRTGGGGGGGEGSRERWSRGSGGAGVGAKARGARAAPVPP